MRRVAFFAALACCCLAACGGTPAPSPTPGPKPAPESSYPASCPGQEPHSPTTAPTEGSPAKVQPPLHPVRAGSPTLVDDRYRVVKLVGVNWYGAESPDFVPGGLDKRSATAIAEEIKKLGFNSVRLPFSNYIVECNPVVRETTISRLGVSGAVHALAVYDRVVAALANQGLMVILDDHTSDPEWCCPDSENALWHNDRYAESQWIADWVAMAQRYRGVRAVVGADLRNEPSGPTEWGTGKSLDWRLAAERAGNAVLSESANPNLIIMVEGIDRGKDLSHVERYPICLRPGQQSPYSGRGPCESANLVYTPHDYAFFQDAAVNRDYGKLTHYLNMTEGWAAAASAAPLWIGEFGTCSTSPGCIRPRGGALTSGGPVGTWFANFTDYLAQANDSWAYWPLNGTQSSPGPHAENRNADRAFGAAETYGVLDQTWSKPASKDLVCALQSMVNPSGATYPASGCGPATPR